MSLELREGYGSRSKRGKVALSVVTAENAAHLSSIEVVVKICRLGQDAQMTSNFRDGQRLD